MKNCNILISLLLLSFLIASCSKDYIVGGEKEDLEEFKNSSSFEVLKKNDQYDTLIQVIEAADLVDEINAANNTFFAPTDYCIKNYLLVRTLYVQLHYNASAVFGLDSLKYYLQNNINNTRDSLKMYLVNSRLTYPTLTATGAFYPTGLEDSQVIVSYENARDIALGYNPVVSSIPKIVYYSFLWYPYDLSELNPASDIPESIGVRTRVIQSGLETSNGIIHKLEPAHILFFHNTKK